MKIFKNETVKSAAKWSVLLTLSTGAAGVIFLQNKGFFLAGLLAGNILAIFRLGVLAENISGLLAKTDEKVQLQKNKPLVGYILYILIISALLAGAVKVNIWLAFGMIAGILTVPAVIFAYSLIRGLGSIRNNFK